MQAGFALQGLCIGKYRSNSSFVANRQQKQTSKVGQLRTFEYFGYMNEFSDLSLGAFNDGKSFFRPDLYNCQLFLSGSRSLTSQTERIQPNRF